MVYTNIIYQAIEEATLKKTDWFNGSDIQRDVEAKVGEPVSTKKIGWYLATIATENHFHTREAREKGKEYLPRALIFGRD